MLWAAGKALFFMLIVMIMFTLLQHVQENLNLTGGRKAGEAQAQAAAQVRAAPAQGGAAAQEVEEDD